MRVLFVDDEPRVLEGIKRMISDTDGGWQIATATSAVEALRILSTTPFDVIVSDMRMPGMDGAQLLAEVHERWPAMTRIVLSGQSDQAMSAATNAHELLKKPCSPAKLAEAVEHAFRCRVPPSAHVQQLAGAVQRLPAMPRVHEALLQRIDVPTTTAEDVAMLVAQDASLCAKVLRIVNAAYTGRTPIIDVRTAAAQIDRDLLRAVLLAERAGSGLSFVRIEAIQALALEAALLAYRMVPPTEQKDAFVASLLCDVGTLVFEQGMPDEIAAVRSYAEEMGVPEHVAEKELLGSSHAEAGAYVLGLWGCSRPILDAVAAHHDLPANASRVTVAVWVAQRLVRGESVPADIAARAGVSSVAPKAHVSKGGAPAQP